MRSPSPSEAAEAIVQVEKIAQELNLLIENKRHAEAWLKCLTGSACFELLAKHCAEKAK